LRGEIAKQFGAVVNDPITVAIVDEPGVV
jgi:hypothetical protein